MTAMLAKETDLVTGHELGVNVYSSGYRTHTPTHPHIVPSDRVRTFQLLTITKYRKQNNLNQKGDHG
jgi:hypothetical protein